MLTSQTNRLKHSVFKHSLGEKEKTDLGIRMLSANAHLCQLNSCCQGVS